MCPEGASGSEYVWEAPEGISGCADGGVPASIAVPQRMQNFECKPSSAPQFEQKLFGIIRLDYASRARVSTGGDCRFPHPLRVPCEDRRITRPHLSTAR